MNPSPVASHVYHPHAISNAQNLRQHMVTRLGLEHQDAGLHAAASVTRRTFSVRDHGDQRSLASGGRIAHFGRYGYPLREGSGHSQARELPLPQPGKTFGHVPNDLQTGRQRTDLKQTNKPFLSSHSSSHREITGGSHLKRGRHPQSLQVHLSFKHRSGTAARSCFHLDADRDPSYSSTLGQVPQSPVGPP